ncbi:hypothetical protein GY45DRAFT_296518 [Cubamyces sp. BRFM 1775]|nr:hypothetical protein GY45DRAFT_296518 [Cubamyces sp. BRFM 1775]
MPRHGPRPPSLAPACGRGVVLVRMKASAHVAPVARGRRAYRYGRAHDRGRVVGCCCCCCACSLARSLPFRTVAVRRVRRLGLPLRVGAHKKIQRWSQISGRACHSAATATTAATATAIDGHPGLREEGCSGNRSFGQANLSAGGRRHGRRRNRHSHPEQPSRTIHVLRDHRAQEPPEGADGGILALPVCMQRSSARGGEAGWRRQAGICCGASLAPRCDGRGGGPHARPAQLRDRVQIDGWARCGRRAAGRAAGLEMEQREDDRW